MTQKQEVIETLESVKDLYDYGRNEYTLIKPDKEQVAGVDIYYSVVDKLDLRFRYILHMVSIVKEEKVIDIKLDKTFNNATQLYEYVDRLLFDEGIQHETGYYLYGFIFDEHCNTMFPRFEDRDFWYSYHELLDNKGPLSFFNVLYKKTFKLDKHKLFDFLLKFTIKRYMNDATEEVKELYGSIDYKIPFEKQEPVNKLVELGWDKKELLDELEEYKEKCDEAKIEGLSSDSVYSNEILQPDDFNPSSGIIIDSSETTYVKIPIVLGSFEFFQIGSIGDLL